MPSPQEVEAALFALAIEKPTGERAAFLQAVCGGNDALRQRLEALLSAHDRPDELLGDGGGKPTLQPTITFELADSPDEAVGQTLGRYKLLERVGEGGCGVVYVAEQTEPVRRRVALKVIKLGMDTKQVVARFEAERQALAMMDHPNIAKVLDAGTTDRGRPYFVMELVRGIKITDYCDQANLSTKERLDLFTKVCQAIQHAHQKGIIHRDIKPSNILVTLHDGAPVPKVIDFGIAKATEGKLTDNTVYTQLHQFIGTPAYMSPEQAEMSGLDIDTRSDIYSLGVLLYELLAGSTPFDGKELMASGLDAMRKTIREKEPPRPSTRLATLGADQRTTTAKRRSADTSKLLHQLRGDLDWIVMRCLEKDRQRRYDTANGLAADIKRYLANEPVLARPPSATYRFQKAFRRNKLAFGAATAVVAALLLGMLAAAWQAVRATRAERQSGSLLIQANEAKAKAEQARNETAAALRRTDEALVRETRLRQEGEARVYGTDLFLAQQALVKNNFAKARELLERHYPKVGQTNRPGWEWRYLWQQARSDYLYGVFQKPGEIQSIATSADGHYLAIGRMGHGVTVLDISNPRNPKELLQIPSKTYTAVAFAPRGALLAYAVPVRPTQGFNTIQVQDLAANQTVATLTMTNKAVLHLRFSAEGRNLLAHSLDLGAERQVESVDLWRLIDSTRLASFAQTTRITHSSCPITVSPDQRILAIAGSILQVIDLATLETRWTATPPRSGYMSAAFSPDGRTLFSSESLSQPILRRWDVATGKEIGTPSTVQARGSTALMVTPDGKKLISGSDDQTIRVWDLADPMQIKPLGRPLQGHRAEVTSFALLPDQKTMLSSSTDGAVLAWDVDRIQDHSEPIFLKPSKEGNWWSGYGPDGKPITANVEGEVVRWTGEQLQFKETLFNLGKPPNRVLFSDNAAFLVVGGTNGVLELWDVTLRRKIRDFGTYSGRIAPLRFSSNKARLLVMDEDKDQLCEWDLKTFQEIRKLPRTEPDPFWKVSPNYQWLVSSTVNGEFTMRALGTDRSVKWSLGIQTPSAIEFSPDEKLLAAVNQQGNIGVWEAATLEPVASLGDRTTALRGVNFSPDGRRLLAGGGGASAVTIWDLATQLPIFSLETKGAKHVTVSFSPDGNFLVSRSVAPDPSDNGLYMWRAPSWEEIAAAESQDGVEGKQP